MMLKVIIPVSFVVFVIAFWNRNDLGNNLPILPQLQQEPIQQAVTLEPFDVTVNERQYYIEPLHEYELYGLVVSYKTHDGDFGLHRRWDDHLNVADICVVWQDNAYTEHMSEFTFWNGQFTCNIQTHSNEAWSSFKSNQLSNNHLITDDEFLRKQISKVSIGDQIRMSGWLANYGRNGEIHRFTSTNREDTGNGACETLYVNDFQVLESYSNAWHKLMYIALFVLIVSLIAHFRRPFKVG